MTLKMMLGLPQASDTTALPPPLERYEFSCNDSIDVFLPTVNGSFLGALAATHPSTLECTSAFGVKPVASGEDFSISTLESENNLVSTKEHFAENGSRGFSVELLITPAPDFRNKTQPIFNIGRSIQRRSFQHGCDGLEIGLAQKGKTFDLTYADDDSSRSCRHLSAASELVGNKTHIVISLSNSTTNIFINRQPVFESGFPNFFKTDLQNWDPTSTLQIFPRYAETVNSRDALGLFSGVVHTFSIYDTFLSQGGVDAAFKAGQSLIRNVTYVAPSGLVAAPSNSYTLEQGNTWKAPLWIGGANSSTAEWISAVQILSLPKHALLFAFNSTIKLETGSIVQLDQNATRAPVHYASLSQEYFNAPNRTANGAPIDVELDSFVYRIIALDAKSRNLLNSSTPVTQPIRVLNVNHKPKLVVPRRITSDMISGMDAAGRPQLSLSGILLVDTDKNVDKVRVDVSARNGSISLNEEHRHLADFDSCRTRISFDWLCHGRGIDDRSMTFLAQPEDLATIFSDMLYKSFFREASDAIVVTVYDGINDGCLTEAEHPRYVDEFGHFYTSIRNGCFRVTGTIRFQSLNAGPKIIEKDNPSVPVFVFWVLLGLVLFCVGYCLRCSCRACLGRTTRIPVVMMPDH